MDQHIAHRRNLLTNFVLHFMGDLMPTAAASDVIASLRWCQASAWTAELSTETASRRTNRKRPSLIATATRSTTRVNGAGAVWGTAISRTAWITIHPAASNSMLAT